MLAKAIRENQSIKGIFVNRREIKLSQYADDTKLILDGTNESLKASLKMLDEFYEVSGLKLNDKKTKALWIGANSGNDGISTPGRNFNWPKYKVKALGVWFSIDPEATATLNYNEKLDKVRNVIKLLKIPQTYSHWKNYSPKESSCFPTRICALSFTYKCGSYQRSK